MGQQSGAWCGVCETSEAAVWGHPREGEKLGRQHHREGIKVMARKETDRLGGPGGREPCIRIPAPSALEVRATRRSLGQMSTPRERHGRAQLVSQTWVSSGVGCWGVWSEDGGEQITDLAK